MARKINYEAINKNAVKNLQYIDNELEKAGYGYVQRLAILGNIQRESNGNPLAISSNGTWHGLVQWNKDRYRLQSNDSQSELQRQTKLLLKELEKTGWSGWTWQDQVKNAQAFKDTTDLKQAVDLFTRHFVRPGDIEDEITKRYDFAQSGWTEEPTTIREDRKVLPDNLVQSVRPLNNKVVNTTRYNLDMRPKQISSNPSWIPTSDVPTEDEIRALVYNAFKYQGGGLIYQGFYSDKTDEEFKPIDLTSFLNEPVQFSFPVEPVKVYKPVELEPEQNISQSQKGTVEYADSVPTSNPISTKTFHEETTPSIVRGTIEFKHNGIDVGNMQELIDLMQDEGISFRITSGNRPGAKTSSGRLSNHGSGNALDITPIKGQTWDDLLNQMRRSKKFITYMNEHGLGILDERGEAMQKKTGATGAHFHIGPDQIARTQFKYLVERWKTI